MALLGNQNIIKFTHHRSDTWANRSSTTMGEIHTNFRMTVTPVRSDSIIIIDYVLPSQRVTMHALNFHNIYQHFLLDYLYFYNEDNHIYFLVLLLLLEKMVNFLIRTAAIFHSNFN